MAKIVRTISHEATVVATAIDALDMVSEIEKIHNTSAVVTAALGRLSIAASLMGIALKGKDDSITLRVNGGGPCGTLIAVADGLGNVKSYVENPVVEIPLNRQGKLDVAGAVGKNGTLSVIKDMGLKEPYSGQIPLVSGEIAEDVASYYALSEQVPTVCALGVLVNPDLTVKAAGGYLIQLLPFAPESVIDTIEKTIAEIPSVTKMLEAGTTADEMAHLVLRGLDPDVMDDLEAHFRCDCSKQRVERALISMGRKELQEMADEEKEQEICCHFCGKKYSFSPADLKRLLAAATRD